MLRAQGLTPDELARRYEKEIERPHGEVDIIKLFGKPPYEFLGDTGDRNYPNYQDFHVDFIDDIGREYQKTDAPDRFFVRIPISLTRQYGPEGKFEDYVGFPNPGDQVNLTWFDKEIHARVVDCPFDHRRAVSNVYFENILKINFIPDFIDNRGRVFMRCVRNNCFLGIDKETEENDVALYYVRLPTLLFRKKYQSKINQIRRSHKKRKSGYPSSADKHISQLITQDFVKSTRPYTPQKDIERNPIAHKLQEKEDSDDDLKPALNNQLLRVATDRIMSLLKTEIVSDESLSSFPLEGETLSCYQLYGDKTFDMLVCKCDRIRKRHSPCSSSIIVMKLICSNVE